MKFSDIQSKSQVELNEMLKELQIKLGKLRFELANKSVKDVSQIKKTKKDIARILTAIKIEARIAKPKNK
ncbi:MAG: 50S ribosomal protein L29 [Candidatus Yanofskybacteria bacterium]|nr:50S ribosomal protein L29 [Candidatus Yanofskybacteria bacterium]